MNWSAVDNYIAEHFDRFVEELQELCRIPSVSSENRGLNDCAQLLVRHLENLAFDAQILPLGGPDNPPLVYASHTPAASTKTLLIYGHFDVQPTGPTTDWDSEPFEPSIRGGYLFGRGTSDAKAQIFAHFKAFEALNAIAGGVPLGIRLVLDPQEEIGTPMMEPFVASHLDLFKADFGLSADGEAFPGDMTTLTYGNRGNCFLTIRFKTALRDAHSGIYGGVIPSATWRAVDFIRTLRSENGRILIDGFYDGVEEPSTMDVKSLRALPTDSRRFAEEMGISPDFAVKDELFWNSIMFQPTCNLAGLSGGYAGPGTKTIIPCEALVKLEMRLVKNQSPADIRRKVEAHAHKHGFADIEIEEGMMYQPARTPLDHEMSDVFRDAVRQGFGHEPLLVPVSGGSSPRFVWTEVAKIPMIEVSYAQHGALAHCPNENMSLDRFRKGIMTSARIFEGLSHY